METNLIETTLPLVYCKKNEFYVLNGLNLERKNELWGIDLSPNCLLSLTKMLNSNDSPIKNKADVQKYVKSMIFKGKHGSLPSAELLGKIWNKEKRSDLKKTILVMENNGIKNIDYRGIIWCSEVFHEAPEYSLTFSLTDGKYSWCDMSVEHLSRIVIVF